MASLALEIPCLGPALGSCLSLIPALWYEREPKSHLFSAAGNLTDLVPLVGKF